MAETACEIGEALQLQACSSVEPDLPFPHRACVVRVDPADRTTEGFMLATATILECLCRRDGRRLDDRVGAYPEQDQSRTTEEAKTRAPAKASEEAEAGANHN